MPTQSLDLLNESLRNYYTLKAISVVDSLKCRFRLCVVKLYLLKQIVHPFTSLK